VSAAATEGENFWGIDYGFEEGRWTYGEGAAYQTNKAIEYDGGTNYGSRAFPVALGSLVIALCVVFSLAATLHACWNAIKLHQSTSL
jgi:hypothetical protein